jgi:hypothetical protein
VLELERDLIRWSRGKWVAVAGVVAVIQLGLLYSASRQPPRARPVYPRAPALAFAEEASAFASAPVELENPFLFAAADWDGFSGSAWLWEPQWTAPETSRRVPVRFLTFAEGEALRKAPWAEDALPIAGHRRPRTALWEPIFPESKRDERSRLLVEGFAGRRLATPLSLPVQYHNDAVTRSVVEAMIDADGLVISAVILERSGSVKADGDALALSKQARFSPGKGNSRMPELGKLIFEWFALDLADTNNVRR